MFAKIFVLKYGSFSRRMSSKRKSPPTKLSTDGLNSSTDRIVEDEEEQLLDQNDNKIQYSTNTPSNDGSDLLSRLANEQFQVALQASSNEGLEMGSGIDSLDVSNLQLSINSTNRPQNSLHHDQDSCDSLTSDGVSGTEQSAQDNVTSSRKQRLLLSVSSNRSETTTDSEYDSEPCLNGNELASEVNTFPYDFLQASLKASGQISDANNGEHLHESSDISVNDNNHHHQYHHMYHPQQDMGRHLSGGHGKRTMDDVLKRLTSKMTTSATLREIQTPGPPSVIISESDYYNRNSATQR